MKTALEELRRLTQKWGSRPAQAQLKTLEGEAEALAQAQREAADSLSRVHELDMELAGRDQVIVQKDQKVRELMDEIHAIQAEVGRYQELLVSQWMCAWI